MMHDVRPKTVLLADDEHTLRGNLAEVLRDERFEVVECEDGMAALKALRKTPVDAIITDLRMPRVTGMELIEYARELAPGAVIIVVTAFGEVDSAVESMKLGAADYISKPLILDEVIFKLKRLLAQVELERENERLRAALSGAQATNGGANGYVPGEAKAPAYDHGERARADEPASFACEVYGNAEMARPGAVIAQGETARSRALPNLPLREATRAFERDYVLAALEQAGGNKHETARRLGIGLSSLYRKLDEFSAAAAPDAVQATGFQPHTNGGGVR